MACEQQSHVHVVIEIVVPAFLKAFRYDLPFPEVRGLRRQVRPAKAMRRRLRDFRTDDSRFVTFTKHNRVAADPLAFRMLGEVVHYGRKRSGKIEIVAVEKGEDVASCSFESFINRMDLAAILFAYPVGETIFVLLDDRDAFVSAAAVDHDVLERFVTLFQDGKDRLFEKSALVV